MARKIKIPNHIKKGFERVSKKRTRNHLNKRRYYLIVCEGEKTEPNYFEALKNDLPKGVITSCQIDIKGTGYNTNSLIEEAQRLQLIIEAETARTLDKLWVVFDKDSFEAEDFNRAINKCKNTKPKIGCAWSNEAFELWYLLHFNYYDTAFSRTRHKTLIQNNLRPKLGQDFEYRKNSAEMYDILNIHGNRKMAIKYAKRLKSNFEGQDYASHNPCTQVYELIEELFGLEDELNDDQ